MNIGIIAESNNRSVIIEDGIVSIEYLAINDLKVTSFNDTTVTLNWTNPITEIAIDYFKIYKNNVFLENTLDATEGYIATGLTLGTFYSFSIEVVYVDSEVSALSNIVVQKTSGGSSNITIPQYAQDAVDAAILDIQDKNPNGDFLSFIFLTDSHNANGSTLAAVKGNNLNSEKTAVVLAQSGYYDFVVHGGDMHDANQCTKTEAFQRIAAIKEVLDQIPIPTYYCKGNHDVNFRALADKEAHRISDEDFYDAYNASTTKNTNPLRPKGNYFYKDFNDYNIRVTITNSCEDSNGEFHRTLEQDNFMTNSVLDTTKELLIFAHVSQLYPASDKKLRDYETEGGRVIHQFSGHLHQDTYNESPYGFNYSRRHCCLNNTDMAGTIDEICFDSITIDNVSKKIYIHRVGGRGVSVTRDY